MYVYVFGVVESKILKMLNGSIKLTSIGIFFKALSDLFSATEKWKMLP